ncbi:MAG: alanine--tRNA ligase [Defluviitaleaceae bacterium]|nr:alanine--tRNA ligase [Defluviitaleaceae bacterium]
MKKLGLNEIREKYLAFFESKEHLRLPSFSLIPENDKTLLLIVAGMAPMKQYFIGQATPPSPRVTTSQKCIRTGDIESVGKTDRHGTFFEMLGNFSFGNYFKEETIAWAWEFLTKHMEIPESKLSITIYNDDDEAHKIWNEKVGVSAERIYRMGKETNFWELASGPCGPCSEIFYDRGPEYGKDDFLESEAAGEDRYIEIWNLVFIQFNKSEDGEYSNLPKPSIDTGMGLERIAMVMQGEKSLFDVDVMKAIRDEICKIGGLSYDNNAKKDISIRLITDHIRSAVFMASDGIMPEGEGRGYVLRRLIRRAARHGRLLGLTDRFLARLAAVVTANFGAAYPELVEKQDFIAKVIDQEEQRFYENLDSGMNLLVKLKQDAVAAGKKDIAGADAFKLHDTFGFPLELTKEILEEEGLAVDEAGFHEEMEKQRNRARAAREDSAYAVGGGSAFDSIDGEATSFAGYTQECVENAKILHIATDNVLVDKASEGTEIAVIVDKTPAYAESGGQMADYATITTPSGEISTTDCIKTSSGQFAHIGKVVFGEISIGQAAKIAIDSTRRNGITRHHSATHLLHMALRDVLGSHVTQAGAAKFPNRLRFDFSHFAPVTPEELAKVENIVNNTILRDLAINIEEMPIADAKARGAVALFGEKYGDIVRVVDIGGISTELCGGTHLKSTAQIGSFKIISESGIAAGVRRVEAIVGEAALAYFNDACAKVAEISAFLKTQPDNLMARIEQLINSAKDAEKQLAKLKQADAKSNVDSILAGKEDIGGIAVASATLEDIDAEGLRGLSDDLISKLGSGVVLLAGIADGKANILVRATKDLTPDIHCGNIVKAAATAAGGGGGGRPDMAQAGIKDAAKVPVAMDAAKAVLKG